MSTTASSAASSWGHGRPDQPRIGPQPGPGGGAGAARQAINQGLVPMIVHAAYDAELLGIDYNRMLAVCFCCDCCCTVRKGLRSGPTEFGDTVLRLSVSASRWGLSAPAAAPVSTSVT